MAIHRVGPTHQKLRVHLRLLPQFYIIHSHAWLQSMRSGIHQLAVVLFHVVDSYLACSSILLE